jgi:chromate transporter
LLAAGRSALLWAAIWAAPLALCFVLLGPNHVLTTLGLFFSKLAVVTFGGAYAVLAYVAQEAVATHGWLKPGEMVDGLGLAETTPGPLILVNSFVGFLAAFRAPAPFTPLVAGILGSAVTLWSTFAPCFLWIFAGAPLIERLEQARRLQGALAMITAAVVGVIGNLTLWFALHVLFRKVEVRIIGPLHISLPDVASFDWAAAGLAALAAVLMLGMRWGVIATLAACIACGVVLWSLGVA